MGTPFYPTPVSRPPFLLFLTPLQSSRSTIVVHRALDVNPLTHIDTPCTPRLLVVYTTHPTPIRTYTHTPRPHSSHTISIRDKYTSHIHSRTDVCSTYTYYTQYLHTMSTHTCCHTLHPYTTNTRTTVKHNGYSPRLHITQRPYVYVFSHTYTHCPYGHYGTRLYTTRTHHVHTVHIYTHLRRTDDNRTQTL